MRAFLMWLDKIGVSDYQLVFVEEKSLSFLKNHGILWCSDVREYDRAFADQAKENLLLWRNTPTALSGEVKH